MVSESDLKKVHYLQLELAQSVQLICEKNNLKYFFIGGTLLGAVRHQGFIPWDDDMDIGLCRDDYDKFCDLIQNMEITRNGVTFSLYNMSTEKNFGLAFSKIRVSGTKYIEKNGLNKGVNQGIFIDVFPFDRILENRIKQIIQYVTVDFYKKIALIKSGVILEKNNVFKNSYYKILKIISKRMSFDKINNKINHSMKKNNNKKTKKIINFLGAYGLKEITDYDTIFPLKKLKFEKLEFNVPGKYDVYLKEIYGDYMQLPPENERNNHDIVELNFGKYY